MLLLACCGFAFCLFPKTPVKFAPVLNLVLRTAEKPGVTQLRNGSSPRPVGAAVSGGLA